MYFDLVILAILIFATIRGALKGIVWQLAVIGALVLCFLFAEQGSVYLAPKIPAAAPLNRWLAMLLIYVVLSLVSFGIARMLRGWIEKARFEEYDRHLGAVLGFVKGATFALVVTFFVVTISEKLRGHVMNSYSGYAAAIVMDRLHPVMPRELHDVLEPYIHQLDRPGMDLEHSHADRHADEHSHGDSGDNSASADNNDANGRPPSLLDALLDELRRRTGEGAGGLEQLAKTAFENTDPADRDELVERIRLADAESVFSILESWADGKPPVESEPPGDGELLRLRSRLLREVAAVFSDFPGARAAIISELERALAGVPDRVAVAVLRDWHADLTEAETDPDPETDSAATLDERIVRQMSAAGIPLSTLGDALQDRLRGWLRL